MLSLFNTLSPGNTKVRLLLNGNDPSKFWAVANITYNVFVGKLACSIMFTLHT